MKQTNNSHNRQSKFSFIYLIYLFWEDQTNQTLITASHGLPWLHWGRSLCFLLAAAEDWSTWFLEALPLSASSSLIEFEKENRLKKKKKLKKKPKTLVVGAGDWNLKDRSKSEVLEKRWMWTKLSLCSCSRYFVTPKLFIFTIDFFNFG